MKLKLNFSFLNTLWIYPLTGPYLKVRNNSKEKIIYWNCSGYICTQTQKLDFTFKQRYNNDIFKQNFMYVAKWNPSLSLLRKFRSLEIKAYFRFGETWALNAYLVNRQLIIHGSRCSYLYQPEKRVDQWKVCADFVA